jgi:hypothetical protein
MPSSFFHALLRWFDLFIIVLLENQLLASILADPNLEN